MKSRILWGGMVLLCLASCVHAGHIELKNSFFSGWKYSTDGITFNKVGTSGKGLHDAMAGNEPAQKHMLVYKSRMTMALVFGYPGGFLVGWPIGGALFGDWKDSYTVMMAIGVPLAVISAVYESSAKSHLKKAVKVYNGEEQASHVAVGFRPLFDSRGGGILVSASWHF